VSQDTSCWDVAQYELDNRVVALVSGRVIYDRCHSSAAERRAVCSAIMVVVENIQAVGAAPRGAKGEE
jgi:hypothetical protein